MPLEFVEKALEVADPKECAWYQTFDWPDGRVVKGRWDYRKNVDDYIGQMNFAEKSVIEIGPASGYITYAMEQRGARVTCIDTDPDQPWEIVPRRDRDTALYYEERKKGVLELRKFWFLSQQVLGGTASMSWCGATRLFDLRNDLNFDVGFVGSVLQHFENPYKVLSALASMCGTIAVTEQSHPRLNRAGSDIAEFLPAHNNNHLGTWWLLSASTVDRMMGTLSFVKSHSYESVFRPYDFTVPTIEGDSFVDHRFYTHIYSKVGPDPALYREFQRYKSCSMFRQWVAASASLPCLRSRIQETGQVPVLRLKWRRLNQAHAHT
jgi:O-methyltransferase